MADFQENDLQSLRTLVEVVGTSTFVGYTRNQAASTAAAVWKIKRVSVSGDVTEVLYANGEETFEFSWDLKETYFANPPFVNSNSLFFLGSNQQLQFPNHVSALDWDGTTARTFSFWFRSNKTGEQAIMSQQSGVNAVGWRVTVQANTTRLHVSGGAGTNRTQLQSANLSLNDGFWHHVVWAVGDISAPVVLADYTLIVDGVDVTAGVTIPNNTLNTPASSNGVPLKMGVRDPNALDFEGFMDEPSVYTTRLTPAECISLYNLGGPGKPGDLINQGPQPLNLPFWLRMGDNTVFPNFVNLGLAGTELDGVAVNMVASAIVGETP